METIYVLEPGSYLRKDGETLKVVRDGQVTDQVPMEGLNRLILIGNISLSSGVLDYLIQQRVETVFLTSTGRYRARLALDEHKHVALRRAQYLGLSQPSFALKTAKIIVEGKVGNMYRFLLRRASQYQKSELKLATARLKALSASVNAALNLDAVRGVEGAVSRIYFQAFPCLIQNPDFSFSGRNRRPPLDPVNALLSSVYTMLTNEVLSAAKTVGLDPYLGALHEVSYGRPSLACDLVEEYRTYLGDRLVLSLINRQAMSPDDFVYRAPALPEYTAEEEMKEKRPVEMKPQICRTFIAAYEQMMKSTIHYPPLGKKVNYRWLFLQQAQVFKRYLEEPAAEYQPFKWDS
ncbi:MAG: CRISPR-associated endonuclease Cas1 [Deltaproteobacteria bacterium]|nr:CRISPR-associated endonuclease Cas1 [Deltaproteobacteria bacterium]